MIPCPWIDAPASARGSWAREAKVEVIERYLEACGWRFRSGKGSHRAWVKADKRTVVIPVHGRRVRRFVIEQVLEATADDD